jgi:hypothetical protein
VEDLWGKLEEDDFVEAMTIARLLWMRRNKWVFDGQFTSSAQVLKQACEAQVESILLKGHKRVKNLSEACQSGSSQLKVK